MEENPTNRALENGQQIRGMMLAMTNRKWLRSPRVLFLALAICLLPLGVVSFHANWPPLTWAHAHFAEGDIGQTILACSGLFFIFSLAYFFLPRVFHLQINEKMGRLHFWTNAIAFLLLLAFPVYFNLSFHSSSGESRLGRFFRAFGASLDSFAWGVGATLVVQALFLGNLLWSIFRGQKKHLSLKTEVYDLRSDELLKRMPKEQAIILVQGLLRRMEESLNVPDIPAAKIRVEKVLEELKLS